MVLSFMKKVSLFILIVFFIGVKILEAQITTTNFTPNNTVVNLANNVLLGNGVQAFNIQVYGAPNQYGYFSNGANSIGLDRGVSFYLPKILLKLLYLQVLILPFQ